MSDPRPFFEYPDGEHATATDAMSAAIERLLREEAREWISVCAQGMGTREDSHHTAEVRLLGRTIDVASHEVNEAHVMHQADADLQGVSVERDGSKITLAEARPRQIAVFLDVMFRTQLQIRGWPDQDDDYAVGFEW